MSIQNGKKKRFDKPAGVIEDCKYFPLPKSGVRCFLAYLRITRASKMIATTNKTSATTNRTPKYQLASKESVFSDQGDTPWLEPPWASGGDSPPPDGHGILLRTFPRLGSSWNIPEGGNVGMNSSNFISKWTFVSFLISPGVFGTGFEAPTLSLNSCCLLHFNNSGPLENCSLNSINPSAWFIRNKFNNFGSVLESLLTDGLENLTSEMEYSILAFSPSSGSSARSWILGLRCSLSRLCPTLHFIVSVKLSAVGNKNFGGLSFYIHISISIK